ncbi:MAG: hypothetical protein Q9161_009249 [Pseudevernia consocians]
MQAACAAGPINASCPITASSDTPPIVASVTGTNYRCVYDDQTNGDPTPSKCYCQCTCMSPAAVESADQEVQREAAAAGAQDNPDAVGEGAGGAPAGPVAGPMTTPNAMHSLNKNGSLLDEKTKGDGASRTATK